jgi:hypothetical protein
MIHKNKTNKDDFIEFEDKRALHRQARIKKERQSERETERQMLQFRYDPTIDSDDEIE